MAPARDGEREVGPMSHALPREIADGVFWLGGCLAVEYQGKVLHGYNSVYLISGSDSSILVETGHPKDLSLIELQLDGLLASGVAPLRHAFVTHTETPHCSGIGRILEHFPAVTAHGALQDLPLVFPAYTDRMRAMDPGDRIDLGGRAFYAVEAVIRDMPYTRWGFDSESRVLFPGDGFSYMHYHEDDHCGCVAEEAPSIALADEIALFAEIALYWTKFVDIEPYIARLEGLLDELDVQLVAPTHGLPIVDLNATFPSVSAGLRLGAVRTATPGFLAS
jgi:flavorubredoxin